MNQSVRIKPILGHWILIIGSDESIDKAYACKRLIDAIDIACQLQLHIENVNELPINQYKGL